MVDKPNILLIAIDTLRADHLSCYGYKRKTSPNIDYWLAEQGVLCEHHSTQASYTHPAYTTILTGHYPLSHRSIVMPARVPPPEGMPMLAELFREGAYYTASVSSLPLSGDGRGAFYGRGFNKVLNYGRQERPLASGEGKASGMYHVNSVVFPLLRDLKMKQPFFLFLHVWDPHRAYTPRRRFSQMFLTGSEPNTLNFSEIIPTAGGKFVYPTEPSGIEYTIAQYDGSIADCDEALGTLFNEMDSLGLIDGTLITFTADHGESLGEHRIYFRHAGIFEPTMHVPLILRYPSLIPKGKRITCLTEHVDISPTLLAFAGLKGGENMAGINLMEASIKGSYVPREAAFAHTPNPDMRRAARTMKYKYMQHIKGCQRDEAFPEEELYDLEDDPNENCNIAEDKPEVTEKMRTLLETWVSKTLAGKPDPMVEQVGGVGVVKRWPVW